MSNPPTIAITGTSSRSRNALTHQACAELRRSRIMSSSAVSPGTPEVAARIGRNAKAKLNRLASSADRRLLVSFIEQQITEHGAMVDPGPADLKYVRLHMPSHRGAYYYPTTRGFVDFRLRPEDAGPADLPSCQA